MEDQIHLSCMQWVFWNEARYPCLKYLMHSPNGGKRSVIEAAKFKRMGVRAGVPDFLLPIASPRRTFQGFACELKSSTGSTTEKQDDWLNMLSQCGYKTSVCRSLDQFIAAISAYLTN
jgi:hypothetical protein